MSGPKRFWKTVAVADATEGFAIALDGRKVRTPAKRAFAVPSRALAEAIAEEWQAQPETMDPASMPLTRYANSVIDGVASQRAEVVGMVAAYGETDLLCYRAEHPDPLIERQALAWDPLLDWARDRYGAPLLLASGVMPVSQPEASIAALRAAVEAHDDYELAALHDLVALSGSLVLGLAVSDARLGGADAFDLSRIDEVWQQEQWGLDAEAEAVATRKARDFADAARFMALVRTTL